MTQPNWLTFVGEGRCGHTIVSAILDAHPNARVSSELKPIAKWNRGELTTRAQIIDAIKASGKGKERTLLPGMLTYTEPLLLVGDKCGWDAVNEYKRRSSADILTRFGSSIELPVKVIHMSRHPLDNISAWVQSEKYARQRPILEERIRVGIRRYARFYEAAERIMPDQDVFHLRHEELCLNTKQTISALIAWVGLPPNREWMDIAVKAIHKKPNRRFEAQPWKDRTLSEMVYWRIIDRFDTLSYYRKPK